MGILLDNYFSMDHNFQEDNYYFYLTNDQGQSILEINPQEKGYRHGSYHDFDGRQPVPESHRDTADLFFGLSHNQFEAVVEAFKKRRKWSEISSIIR